MDFASLEENFVRRAYDDLNCRQELSIGEQKGKRQRLPAVAKLLKSLPANALILDIGCGRKSTLRADCFTVGVDICVPSDREAGQQQRNANNFVLADAQHLPFREGVFDAVLLVSVLHHIAVEQRRLKCLQSCLSLASPANSSLLVVVWAKEQQTARFPANDVLVPYNLEDLYTEGHIAAIPFHKYSTKEQRIIMNSLPVRVADSQLLRQCCRQYVPRRFQKQLLEVAVRLASLYPMFVSLDFYEQRLQHAVQFVIERIGEFSSSIGFPGNSVAPAADSLAVVSNFALKLSLSIFVDAFAQLGTLHREVLKYRYYHVFQAGELQRLFGQIRTTASNQLEFGLLESDFEHGNWCILAGRGKVAQQQEMAMSNRIQI